MATLFAPGGALLSNLLKNFGKKILKIVVITCGKKTATLKAFGSLKALSPWWSSFTLASTFVFLQQELSVVF